VLFDRFGIRWLLPLASVVYVAAFVGLAFSRTYGEFMGCFSVAGVAAGMLVYLLASLGTGAKRGKADENSAAYYHCVVRGKSVV
jgi:hypothetical protein